MKLTNVHIDKALRLQIEKRSNRARIYFDELAGNFGEKYVPGRTWKSVAEMLFKMINPGVVADLGAGEGTLSQLIAQKAKGSLWIIQKKWLSSALK